MSLLKCPDCGNLVSGRAAVCIRCGCPREYFEEADQIEEEAAQIDKANADERILNSESENEGNDSKDKDVTKKREVLASFTVLGANITYYKDQELYIDAARRHRKAISVMEDSIEKIYHAANDIDAVWNKIVPFVQGKIDGIISENIGILYKRDVIISEEAFKQKYKLNFIDYLDPLVESYNQIIGDAKDIQIQRKYERAGRSKWQGGGFGLKGAIKGAMTAGALNMVTGAGRSIGDSIVDGSDRAALQNKKQALKKDESNLALLIGAMRYCSTAADLSLAEEYVRLGFTQDVKFDRNQALQGYKAITQYERDVHRRAAKFFSQIGCYPFYEPQCMSIYQSLIDETSLIPEELDELLKFMKFWNMDCDFPLLIEKVKKRDLVLKYLNANRACCDVDFEDFSAPNYRKLKKIRQELEKHVGDVGQVELVPFCKGLVKYFDRCLLNEKCFKDLECLGDVNGDTETKELIRRIHAEKGFLQGFFKDVWVLGDNPGIPADKLKRKWMLPDNDIIYMYQNRALLGTVFGGDGFILTNTLICDLKTKKYIKFEEAKNLSFTGDKMIFSSETDTLTICVNLGNFASENLFYEVLKFMMLTPEERHIVDVEKAADCIIVLIKEYAARNAIKDVEMLLWDFLKRYQLKNEKIRLPVECAKCGKKLDRDAKFCSFCGEPNPLWLRTCSGCGKQVRRGMKFCNFCGYKFED